MNAYQDRVDKYLDDLRSEKGWTEAELQQRLDMAMKEISLKPYQVFRALYHCKDFEQTADWLTRRYQKRTTTIAVERAARRALTKLKHCLEQSTTSSSAG